MTMTPNDFNPGDYAAGYDAATYSHGVTNNLIVDALADGFRSRADMYKRIADADENRGQFESAAYKAGVAYALRASAADIEQLRVRVVAPEPAVSVDDPAPLDPADRVRVRCTCPHNAAPLDPAVGPCPVHDVRGL